AELDSVGESGGAPDLDVRGTVRPHLELLAPRRHAPFFERRAARLLGIAPRGREERRSVETFRSLMTGVVVRSRGLRQALLQHEGSRDLVLAGIPPRGTAAAVLEPLPLRPEHGLELARLATDDRGHPLARADEVADPRLPCVARSFAHRLAADAGQAPCHESRRDHVSPLASRSDRYWRSRQALSAFRVRSSSSASP